MLLLKIARTKTPLPQPQNLKKNVVVPFLWVYISSDDQPQAVFSLLFLINECVVFKKVDDAPKRKAEKNVHDCLGNASQKTQGIE